MLNLPHPKSKHTLDHRDLSQNNKQKKAQKLGENGKFDL